MANGGIIGPPNTFSSTTLSEKKSAVTASGTFTVQCAPAGGTRTGTVLVVAGGGSGGSQAGGGGGAGGFRLIACQTFPLSGIPVTIGGGGAGKGGPAHPVSPSEQPGSQGTDTVFGNPSNPITSDGGGAGVHQLTDMPNGRGGSGGGGTCNASSYPEIDANGNTPPTSPSQGNPGGRGTLLSPGGNGGGGGGGASVKGVAASGGSAGAGGAGSPVTSTFGCAPQPFYGPTNGVYSGGGGGCYDSRNPGTGPGPGGAGGGTGGVGNGNSANATDNTGGGSGGGNYGPGGTGGSGNGGSGVVLVKEDAISIKSAPGIWDMTTVYEQVKAGEWTNT